MPGEDTGRITIEVPYGRPGVFSLWVRDTAQSPQEFNFSDRLIDHITTKRINNLWYSELRLAGIGSVDKNYIEEGNAIKLFAQNTLVLKGYIEKVDFDSYGWCTIKVLSSAFKMARETTNTTYTNTATNTIVTALIPSTMTEGTNTNYGEITARFDNENNLKGIKDLAKFIDYYWWESHSYPFNADTMNFSNTIGDTNTKTFNISGSSANLRITTKETDKENMVNHVVVLGYGDGTNQLKSEALYATDTRTTLASDLSASETTTLSLTDATDFDSSGDVWVGCEKITYTGKSSNDLTTLTRNADRMGNVATTESIKTDEGYAHKAGVEIYDAQYTAASPETDTSMDLHGIVKKEFNDPAIVDQNTLDRFAYKILNKYKLPIERIQAECGDVFDVLDDVSIGDTVTVTDATAGLSGTYKVVGMEFGFSIERGEFLNLELSNKRVAFIDQVEEISDKSEKMSIYMQGATNIYAVNVYENCDDSTNLDMRFYLPATVAAITSFKLNFKLKDFRYYTTTTPSGGTHTSSAGAAHNHTITVGTTGTAHQHIIGEQTSDWPTSGYPQSVACGTTVGGGDGTHSHTAASSDNESSHTHTVANHTHAMAPTITEETLSSPSVDLYIGEDGSEASEGTYTTDQSDLDITTEIRDVGTGKWVNIQFRPNKRMRIEATLYGQVFVKSS